MIRTSYPNAFAVSGTFVEGEPSNGYSIGVEFGIHGRNGNKTKYMLTMENAKELLEGLTKVIELVEKGSQN